MLVWPAEPWRSQGWTDSSREAAARPRREQPARQSRQQAQIYASPRPRPTRRRPQERGGREVSWVKHVIWWQVYPLGFLGAEKELGAFQAEVSRLPGLQGWLDHLISWGGNGLLLGPIFTSRSHGYDTIDYFQIDP